MSTSTTSPSIPTQFTGYGAKDLENGKKLELDVIVYTPKNFTENDIDIKVSHCGVCGSDIHVLSSGWQSPTKYHCIAGHEVVGTVVRAGSNTSHKVGDRVGVGAQGGSCLECEWCDNRKEQFCDKGMIGTYQGTWEDGSIAQGGYADYMRCQGHFAIKLPEKLESAQAAPLLCAGATTYSPLKRFGCGPGKKVGVIGIGGLGHLALQWAKAMGADTYALSHSDSKVHDAEKLGVPTANFIITKDQKATLQKWTKKFDLLLCTSFQSDLPIDTLFLKLLRPEGTLCLCGLPEEKLPAFWATALIGKNVSLAGSLIAGTREISEMLEFAAEHDVKAWIEERPMKEASQTVKDMENGKARYRYVLVNPATPADSGKL